MSKIVVEIEWDWPDEPFWLNADNVALALHAYCPNTKFQVRQLNSAAPKSLLNLAKRLTDYVRLTIEIGKLKPDSPIGIAYRDFMREWDKGCSADKAVSDTAINRKE